MTKEQIQNSIELCKNQPVSKVMQLFNIWRHSDVVDMASYFGCEASKTAVAAHLINGK